MPISGDFNPILKLRAASRVCSCRFVSCILICLFNLSTVSLVPLSQLHAQEPPTQSKFLDERAVRVTEDALKWLAERQNEDGTFGTARTSPHQVGVTALCGMAFLASGSVPEAGPYAEHVSKCVQFMLSCSQPNGYLVNTELKTHGPMYGHGFGTMFLAEVYGMSNRDDLRLKLKKAVNLIIATQNPEGGWRYNPVPDDADISVTVCQVMALRAARNAGIAVPKEVIDRAVMYLKKCQNPDGGFRYRIFDAAESKVARSAAALVALYTAGITDDPALQRGFEYLKTKRGLNDDRAYRYYAAYYSAQAYWHSGGEDWSNGFPVLRDRLLDSVNTDHWEDTAMGNEYATAMALIALQIPNNLVPIFER
ncbi:prenyltransferase/squalene oxidase repeat-containing protein [Thalassoglobus sp.]|uniref:prenyltransferase/squalene oxidase repeat-containing protein n=1 Tax=Thalassoglobus sp. TaxID=2795869 RepID=UPI003AA8C1E6